MIGEAAEPSSKPDCGFAIFNHQSPFINSIRVFRGEIRDPVDLLAFGPGERLAAAASGRDRVDVWDSVTGHQADAWLARQLSVSDIGFLPDGRVVACVSRHPLQVIDPDTSDK